MGVWALSSLVAPIPGAGKSLVGRAAARGRDMADGAPDDEAPDDGAAADVAGAGEVGAGDRLRDSDGAAAGAAGDDGGAAAGTGAAAEVSARAAGLIRRLR
jgi:hypothetical protein